jgi:hypothetical protein
MKTVVVITFMPPRTLVYFDWLITGLGILAETGQIELRYEGRIWNKVLQTYPWVIGGAWKISSELVDFLSPVDQTCLTGRVEKGGRVATFAMDIADSPFNYALGLLEAADLYFKCQCPVRFDPEGYVLNKHIRIPYHPEVFTSQHKIRAAMLGRPLAGGIDLRKNLAILRQWESAMNAKKDIRLFASFEADRTVIPRTPRCPLPAQHNYGGEKSLTARWGNQIHHPNLKRDRVVGMLRAMGKDDVNARIWGSSNPVITGKRLSSTEYRETLGRSMLNVNISGLRRSLPFRFMDTLMTGGAMATDTMAIRWYREFDKESEIFEIGDLGYELEEDVRWDRVADRLHELYEWAGQHKDNALVVMDHYQKKWAPPAFASYFVDECLKSMEAGAAQPPAERIGQG